MYGSDAIAKRNAQDWFAKSGNGICDLKNDDRLDLMMTV